MKKIFNFNRLLIIGILAILSSCQKMSYDQQFSSAYPLSGEWTIRYEYPDATGDTIIDGPNLIYVFNSSFSKDSILIEDHVNHSALNFGPYRFKARADMKNLTFNTTTSPSSITLVVSGKNVTYEDVCTLQNGKVINKDSIYMEIGFDSDPGTTYKVYGHRKTSYEEYMGL